MIKSSIGKRMENVSYLTLTNPTDTDQLVSVWVDEELYKLTMIKSHSQKQVLLGNLRENAGIVIKEQN